MKRLLVPVIVACLVAAVPALGKPGARKTVRSLLQRRH